MARTTAPEYRAALKISEHLSAWDGPRERGAPVTDSFSLMDALVAGATPKGLCFAEPALLGRYAWWQEDWDRDQAAEWRDELAAWREIVIEPLGRNCYSPDELFDVIVIQRKSRFHRWRARPPFTAQQRIAVYARDNGMCVHCGATESLSIDHIHPWSKGGAHEMFNFQTLCRSCNSRKGARI